MTCSYQSVVNSFSLCYLIISNGSFNALYIEKLSGRWNLTIFGNFPMGFVI